METTSILKFTATKPKLKANRWEPEADELAVFFPLHSLGGVFTSNLYVPPGTRALLLKDNKLSPLEEGEHNIATLGDKVNNFFGSAPGEVLITRLAALQIPFTFTNLRTTDRLDVQANTSLLVQVGDEYAFRNHFMRQPGTITVAHLQELLAPPLRQIVSELIRNRPYADLETDATLRNTLSDLLDSDMRKQFNHYGLGFHGAETFNLHSAQAQTEQQAAALARQDAALRERFRRGELGDDEAAQAQQLRQAEIANLDIALQATSRQQALNAGAGEVVENLEQELAARQSREQHALGERWQAEDAASQWQHLRELARIRRDNEARTAHEASEVAKTLEQERINNTIEKQRIQTRFEQARLIDDETQRKNQLNANFAKLAKIALREQELEQARHDAELDSLRQDAEMRRHQAACFKLLEDTQLEAKLAELRRKAAVDTAQEKLSGLRELMAIDQADDDADLEREIKKAREQARLEDEKANQQLERELRRRKEEREAARELREDELNKIALLNTVSIETLISAAETPEKTAALLKITLARVHLGMSADQISASQSSDTPAPSEQEQWQRFQFMHDKTIDAMKDMGDKIKDAAIGVAAAGRQAPPPSGLQRIPQSSPLAFKNCPKCRTVNAGSANYCSACSHALS